MAQLLREEVDSIERQNKAHIQAIPDLKRDYCLLTSIRFVGPQLGMHMLVVLRSHNFESAERLQLLWEWRLSRSVQARQYIVAHVCRK